MVASAAHLSICPKTGMQTLYCPETLPLFSAVRGSIPDFRNSGNARGYILSPTDSGQSCTHDLEITLIGDCIRSFPAVAQALHAGKSTGLGPSRIPYQVAGMSEVSPDGTVTRLSVAAGDGIGMGAAASLSDWLAASPAITGNMDVSFLTPFRLKKQGKYLGQMDWSHYFATLVRRLESLNCLFFDGASIGKKRYQKLIQQFSEVSAIRQDLSWLDYNRYSNRQHKKGWRRGFRLRSWFMWGKGHQWDWERLWWGEVSSEQ